MQYRKLGNSNIKISVLGLGTWAFGADSWWGYQNNRDSFDVLDGAISSGINLIDTAPVYGRGHSEEVIGEFLRQRQTHDNIIIATKLGLSWEGRKISHDLSEKRMLQEIDDSLRRLNLDHIDLYQVHWPDPATPIAQTAAVMHSLYQKKIIRAVGVSNYSVEQMTEFIKHCPLHCLQTEYSMFSRDIENNIVPFCAENNIAIITYAPLYSSILTGKFFLDNVKIPGDINRKIKKIEMEEPRYTINRETLLSLKSIAVSYGKTLTQMVINWNFSHEGITSAIVGMRAKEQLEENLGSVEWTISDIDMQKIDEILKDRLERIAAAS